MVSSLGLLERTTGYYITGGMALDLLRPAFTRPHSDIDVLVPENVRKGFFAVAQQAGYAIQEDRKLYRLVAEGAVPLHVWPLQNNGVTYLFEGNKESEVYPKELFQFARVRVYGRRRLVLAPNELLVFHAQHSKYEEDKLFGTSLPHNKSLLARIRSFNPHE